MKAAKGITRRSVLAAGAAPATTPLARLAGAAQNGGAFPADFR
jgi:hypothetical protein